jgi:hypothetical protein
VQDKVDKLQDGAAICNLDTDSTDEYILPRQSESGMFLIPCRSSFQFHPPTPTSPNRISKCSEPHRIEPLALTLRQAVKGS